MGINGQNLPHPLEKKEVCPTSAIEIEWGIEWGKSHYILLNYTYHIVMDGHNTLLSVFQNIPKTIIKMG